MQDGQFAFLSSQFWITLGNTLLQWSVRSLPAVLLILLITVVALRVCKAILRKTRQVWFERLTKSRNARNITELEKRADTLLNVVYSAVKITVWIISIMLILKHLGIDIAPLLAGAGIIGLAIGFGAQELVRDFISGFFILLENQIRTGDVAIINGTGGLVETISLRTIILRDLSGVVHVFQNGKINTLANMTKEWSGMVFDIGVAYKENTDDVMRIMKDVADEMRHDEYYGEQILEDIEIFGVDKFSDSAIIIKARMKTQPIKQWETGREYRRRLKLAFDEHGITIPFPQRTVYWGTDT